MADDRSADPILVKREYELLRSLGGVGVVRPMALIAEGGKLAMQLDATDGVSLAVLLAQPPPDLSRVLGIMIGLTQALESLHAAQIVHGDLRPANVLVDGAGHTVRVADLSVAARRMTGAGQAAIAPSDWAYVSPEQTGRINREVDHRADFYALGIVLYLMLTGRLPFQASDAMEWVHCHVARVPQPPAELSSSIPRAVSDITMKLLAKTAEQRYQSAHGLRADLERVLSEWQTRGHADAFTLGRDDALERLQIAHKLYGREAESEALLEAFTRVAECGRPEMVLVAGYAGIGKTSLVHELHKPVAAARGYFVAGKFDRLQRAVPYSALTQALSHLVRQILSESEESVAAWRCRLNGAMGVNGQLMVDMIPALELLAGTQPPVVELGPTEAQNRLGLVFRRFIGVFTRKERPLVLFLDDLQWADSASLALVRELVTHPEIHTLLLVGAYRDNEVNDAHPLMLMLERARNETARIGRIVLQPLTHADVAGFLSDTMHCAIADAQPLAELIHDKTGGNPFFVIQFLTELHSAGLVAFDSRSRRWCWDIDSLRAKNHTDNVVELMLGKLRRLPARAQHVLQRAACLGTAGETSMLAMVLDRSEDVVLDDLAEAARASLIVHMDGGFRFVHDRVQEAAYALIPEAVRATTHLQIGRLLLQRLPPEQIEQRVFEVVDQLNRGVMPVADGPEAARLAQLNLVAGKRAKRAIAFASARDYFVRALALWSDRGWHQHYAQALQLHLDLAECEYLMSSFERAEEWLGLVLAHARSDEDRVRAYGVRIMLYMASGRFGEAVDAALAGLRLHGLVLPDTDEQLQAMIDIQQREIAVNLRGRHPRDLLDAPLLSDPSLHAVMRVLGAACSAAYIARPALFPLLVSKAVNLSLRHGNCAESCVAYAYYAGFLIGRFQDSACAFEYSELSLRLNEKLADPRHSGQLQFAYYSGVYYWQRPYAASANLLEQAFSACLQVGDLVSANLIAGIRVLYVLESGAPLDDMLEASRKFRIFFEGAGNPLSPQVIRRYEQFARCLMGLTHGPTSLDDGDFSEAEHVAVLAAGNSARGLAIYHALKQALALFAGHHDESLQHAAQAAGGSGAMAAISIGPMFSICRVLAHSVPCARGSAAQQPELVSMLETALHKFERWTQDCPQNFLCLEALTAAELARVQGRDLDAEHRYEQAIAAARDNGFLHYEALAHERAAAFHRERGFAVIADAYLREALTRYGRWGAVRKVQQIEARYPHLHAALRDRGGVEQLDTLAVVKASQSISSQIDLYRLIDSLLRIALENAGAQSGQLYFADGAKLVLAATATVKGPQIEVQVFDDADQAQAELQPTAILNYVQRTRELVLLADAGVPNAFPADPYLHQHGPKSVLCLPLQRGEDLMGVLYLEHRLATHAFTPDRVAVLGLLAAQAAISVETARLYAALKTENAERRRAEQVSRERQARIERLVESNIIGIRIGELDGRITDANDAFLQIVGYTREDLATGRLTHHGITPPEWRAADARARQALLDLGRYAPYEKEYTRKDGSRIPVLVGGTLFEGVPAQTVAFVLDLTERRNAEAEHAARKAAEVANHAKSAFLANMSHELRTPLNAILGYAQILGQADSLDERQAAGLDTIRRSGEHLLLLITDMLDLARIEAGKMELYIEDMDLGALVRTVCAIVRIESERKELQFTYEMLGPVPTAVRADEKRLRQVLLNLLNNAVKFTAQGKVALQVTALDADAQRVRLRFEVADTGIGIDEEQVARLFRPFEQAANVQRRFGGAGLGLAISRQLVTAMGSDIHVDSQPGEGSRFWFDLELPLAGQGALADNPAIAGITGYEGPRRQVLVVDDVDANRAPLVQLLGRLGFATLEAANGDAALRSIEQSCPDLVLMDTVMPVMDGTQAIRRLRRDERFSRLPVIAVSANASPAERESSLASGADAFLPKPVDFGRLLPEIARLLRLTWTRGDTALPDRTAAALRTPLPPEELAALVQLARVGNMRGIRDHALRLATVDEVYRPLAARLRKLAEAFESAAITQLVASLHESAGRIEDSKSTTAS